VAQPFGSVIKKMALQSLQLFFFRRGDCYAQGGMKNHNF